MKKHTAFYRAYKNGGIYMVDEFLNDTARLTEAAPDLLAALEALHSLIGHEVEENTLPSWIDNCDEMLAARAAIAKARQS